MDLGHVAQDLDLPLEQDLEVPLVMGFLLADDQGLYLEAKQSVSSNASFLGQR